MNFRTNFVVNYEGHSEFVKVTPDISFDLFWKKIKSLFELPKSLEVFLYAVPNDYSSPIHLTTLVYASLLSAAASVGVNNVVHLRILTPASFIFQVNPSHFGMYDREQRLASNRESMSISSPQLKSIKADFEGLYSENCAANNEVESPNDGKKGLEI